MIAIAVMAGLLSLPATFSLTVVAFSMPCAAVGIAQWFVHRRHLRLAAYCFWGVAISINLLTALSCIVPSSSLHFAIFLGLIAVGIPTILALGVAWHPCTHARNGCRRAVGTRRDSRFSCLRSCQLRRSRPAGRSTCWPFWPRGRRWSISPIRSQPESRSSFLAARRVRGVGGGRRSRLR